MPAGGRVRLQAGGGLASRHGCGRLVRRLSAGLSIVTPWFTVDAVDEGVLRITEPRCHRMVRPNYFFIRGADADLLFDTGMGIARLRPLIASRSARPLIIVASHPEFPDAAILVHPLEADTLRRAGTTGLAFPPRPQAQRDALERAGITFPLLMADAVPWSGYDIDACGRAGVHRRDWLRRARLSISADAGSQCCTYPATRPGASPCMRLNRSCCSPGMHSTPG